MTLTTRPKRSELIKLGDSRGKHFLKETQMY